MRSWQILVIRFYNFFSLYFNRGLFLGDYENLICSFLSYYFCETAVKYYEFSKIPKIAINKINNKVSLFNSIFYPNRTYTPDTYIIYTINFGVS